MSRPPIRVLCVDDHGFLIEGLSARFDMAGDIQCVGRLETAENLLAEARRLKPDIVMLDVEMPGPDPFDAADMLRQMMPDVRTVFLSAYVRDHYISAAVDAGAYGYFSKSDDMDRILDGLREVVRGKFSFGPKVRARLRPRKAVKRGETAPPTTRLDTLSQREQEILRLIGRGLSRSEIAETACISPKTVDHHRDSIMKKLDLHDRADLVRFAIREGLVEV